MNATKNNRIIGTSVGMALAMFAGAAFGACPPDGDKTVAMAAPVSRLAIRKRRSYPRRTIRRLAGNDLSFSRS